MSQRPVEVVDIVEGRDVALALPHQDRLARRLVRSRAQAGVIEAHDRLHVLAGAGGFGDRARRRPGETLALRGFRPVILDIGVALRVGGRPLGAVGLEGALAADERRLGRQGHQLGRRRTPVVEHPLRVLGVPHQAAQPPAPIDMQFVAIDRHDRNVPPRPIDRLQHLRAGHDPLGDLVARHRSRTTDDAHAQGVEHRLLRAIDRLIDHLTVGQRQDRSRHRLPAPVLGHQYLLAVEPGVAQRGIGVRRPVDGFSPLPARGKGGLGQGVDHERLVPVGAVGRCPVGIAIDRKRVRHPFDRQILVEGVVAGVAGVDPEIPEAAGYGEIKGGVIGDFGVRAALDVADQAVQHLRRGRVSIVVDRMDDHPRLVLTRVVDDLPDEGGQAVERQHRPAVQLALAPHPLRPLLAKAGEPQIVQRLTPVLGFGFSGAVERLASLAKDFVVGQGSGLTAKRPRQRAWQVGRSFTPDRRTWMAPLTARRPSGPGRTNQRCRYPTENPRVRQEQNRNNPNGPRHPIHPNGSASRRREGRPTDASPPRLAANSPNASAPWLASSCRGPP